MADEFSRMQVYASTALGLKQWCAPSDPLRGILDAQWQLIIIVMRNPVCGTRLASLILRERGGVVLPSSTVVVWARKEQARGNCRLLNRGNSLERLTSDFTPSTHYGLDSSQGTFQRIV